MADIQVSDPGTRLRDTVVTVSTGDTDVRRMEEQIYLQNYAALMNGLDPSRGFEVK